MTKKGPSVRTIAQETGFSKATVANALRGDGTVAPATAERILAVARKVGYRRNSYVTTCMSAMRRAQMFGFHGVLASLEIAEPDRPEHGPFHRELVVGARTRAEELGFKLEEHVVGPRHLSLGRFESILKARGIPGIVILPSWRPPDLSLLDWSSFAAVSADHMNASLQLHTVCCDHYRSMLTLLEHLHSLGYRRPGLVLETGRDERVMLRMSAGLHSFHRLFPSVREIALLDCPTIDRTTFVSWFRRQRPDVVLSHDTGVIGWLEEQGVSVPGQCGFVCLNLAKATRACAGLDLQPRLIGARSVELLIAQLQQNERGVPEYPSTLTLAARVVEGPTLEPRR